MRASSLAQLATSPSMALSRKMQAEVQAIAVKFSKLNDLSQMATHIQQCIEESMNEPTSSVKKIPIADQGESSKIQL